jgi:hypothetical protein
VINYGNRKCGGVDALFAGGRERECVSFAEYQELLGVVLAILQKVLWQNIQNYSEWSWQFCERFCGSGESSLVPNTYPKRFVSCGGRERVFQEFESFRKWE